ncbi:hypothetical protein HMPREF1548_05127 [Clostridium sp. KLE 1755]|nr:hypothetical protein HMPREF1548_05127 [Clostridium sp. KLE 1755]
MSGGIIFIGRREGLCFPAVVCPCAHGGWICHICPSITKQPEGAGLKVQLFV